MPSRNTRKHFQPNSNYHIYNRGINKQDIFGDDQDFNFLLSVFARYLDPFDSQVDFDKIPYKKFNEQVEMQCYCFMSNHFHLLIKTKSEPAAISEVMQCIWTTYTRYFNKKHNRLGPLFQDRFKASPAASDEHLAHITRYIHLNPPDPARYPYSSARLFLGLDSTCPGWLNPTATLKVLDGINYREFLFQQESA